MVKFQIYALGRDCLLKGFGLGILLNGGLSLKGLNVEAFGVKIPIVGGLVGTLWMAGDYVRGFENW